MVKGVGNPENRDKWDSHSKVRVERSLAGEMMAGRLH